ncbi:MAG: phospho-N-acetylmuramoyl-pentapeptide-transferase [Alphaproteobacteria bacterium]
MLYWLLYPLSQDITIFNVFRYITFRSGGAILTSLVISFILGPRFIAWLKYKQKEGQPIREDGPESHLLTKKGTPTMGGAMILFALGISTLLWADLSNAYVWIILLVTMGFGGIGAVDDYLKLTKRSSDGLSGRFKLILQTTIAIVATYFTMQLSSPEISSGLAIPLVKSWLVDLGIFFMPWAILVIIGSSNAVNLTDGLDGLVTVPVMIAAACFGLIAYLVGNQVFANYLQLHYIAGTGELAVVCGALIGGCLGFLWYNAPPAKVFMGDTGSLAVGGLLGTVSVITKHEIVLSIIGGLFVIEAVSVMMQVGYFKMTGKRIFLMAPIHHHFEKKGWAEPTIVIRFWIIAMILALIGLSTLKLR